MGRTPSDIAARVVHAARRRFLNDGVEGASLRAIAHDAGTSIGMIYYYFPTKDDLFLAVVEEIYVALLDDLEGRLARTRPVLDRVRLLYERLGELAEDEQQVLRLVIREALASPTRLDKLIRRFQRGHLPLLFDLARDGVTAGVFRDDVPIGLLLGVLAALGGPAQVMLGVAGRRFPGQGFPAPRDRAKALVAVLLGGVGTRKPRRRSAGGHLNRRARTASPAPAPARRPSA
jgi:AcrR family transcriptional regulator